MGKEASSGAAPDETQPRPLLKRAVWAVAALVVFALVVLLTPGLDEARGLVRHADAGWVALACLLELASCWCYVVAFRPVFCLDMSWRAASELAWTELGIGSLVPASGAGGLAFGAWVLTRSGMDGEEVARRSVAFFLLKSLANFVAVAVIGVLLALSIVGPHQPLWRTALPAVIAVAAIAVVVFLGRRDRPSPASDDAGRLTRWWRGATRGLVGGVQTAGRFITHPAVIAGSLGYWLFDNAVLWATYHAVGADPAISVILMGYLIGQLGGALPLPGGIGGIDGGLIGALIVYGAPASATIAAVLIYRLILFWLPLLGGAIAFVLLRRSLSAGPLPVARPSSTS